VLGGDGTPITGTTSLVTIGLEGSAVTDQTAMRTALAGAGATPARITTALAQAAAHPDQFVAVLDVTEARYEQLRPAIYPVPGTRFVRHTAVGAVTADLAAHVVGSVGPVSAEELKVLGDPYESGDMVGQSGIESAYERQLAGAPGGDVRVVDAGGRVVATVATFPARPGTPVRTTLDLGTEHAAETALDGVPQPAALVAVRASTGEVLAAVSRPTATPFDRALEGRYPPGSTFKVITTTALLEGGLTPDSPAACPPTLTVDGRTFHNIDGEAARSLPLHRAFAVSCNTAFIGLAGRLAGPALVSAASQFGFGTPVEMGLAAFGGQVPPPSDPVDEAATAIGQGRVEASPLAMAMVAAAVDAGSARAPRLVDGAADDTAPPRALPPAAVDGLRAMMAEVVTSGTGTPAAVPGGLPVFGKTGTAEFGAANPPATHAWFIGFRGDIAFAVVVEGGGTGGPVAGPVAARFLEAR
jgi:cell division protein FtsI/penicillin-binding protein 2